MKISIKELRKIVQETIENISEAQDKDLAIGDIVNVIVNNKQVQGKIVDRFSAKHINPMAVGKNMPHKIGSMMWTVNVNGKTLQVPADELDIVKSHKEELTGSKKPTWKTDYNKTIQEAPNTMSRMTMLHSDDSKDDYLEDDNDEILLDEADEKKEVDDFDERRYDTIARQLVMNWEDRSPEANWKAIAKSYTNAKKSVTGKTLDSNALYDAIVKFLETDGDTRNQCILGGTHAKWA